MPDLPREKPGFASRYRRGRLWLPVFVMTGISFLSGTSGPQLGPVSFAGIDKLGHFLVFGLLGIAWVRFLEPGPSSAVARWLLAVLLTGLFGLLDELHQFHTPGRYFEWADLTADFMGAGFWSATYLMFPPWRDLLERKFCDVPRLRRSD